MSANLRTCIKCNDTKPEKDFYKSGKYLKSYCKTCDNAARGKRPLSKLSDEAQKRKRAWIKRNAVKQSRERALGINIAKYIYWDSRRDDNKRGFKNDLTKEHIADQIAKGCSYCGETELRMTMDRINNDVGHTMENTLPACIRCNYTRRNMPYEAWVVVARAMKRARKQGFFGNWTGRVKQTTLWTE